MLIAIFAFLQVGASAQSGGFGQLQMQNGKETPFGRYSLRLGAPDNQDKPTLWEGPLTISHGNTSCTVDVSLVTAIYASSGRPFVVVLATSGSNAIARFVDLASCGSRWPLIKRAAGAVTVAGDRLSFLPTCEGGGQNAPALCSAARVYRVQNDAPPAYRREESYKLTAKELGVGFAGEAKIMDPRTPRALIVH